MENVTNVIKERCPNCKRELYFYHGVLGYESVRCKSCDYEEVPEWD